MAFRNESVTNIQAAGISGIYLQSDTDRKSKKNKERGSQLVHLILTLL
ncbi:hypothetical protein RRG08_042940 [Elysia crispata]|uniref:Uncharacterized protein n=1 Tax=Elysia crispata TaxID=231223 RepID=A0AAE1AVG5_9GAST|nr:hypothetical protein RRG08_042940 [Elysia crispata]